MVDEITDVDLPIGQFGIVSPDRKRATAFLSKAALTLHYGDFVETGCFVGTSSSIMLRVMRDFDACGRKLWVFDSFEGLPAPTKEDKNQGAAGLFNVSMEMFTSNLQAVGLFPNANLDITKGWFRDTLPLAPVKHIAFLRLDGDLYESTWDAITALYDRVLPGGIIYADDYGSFEGCRRAIDKFRAQKHIYEPLHYVQEHTGVISDLPRIICEAVWWVKRFE